MARRQRSVPAVEPGSPLSVILGLPDAVVLVGGDARIRQANAAASALLDVQLDALHGTPIHAHLAGMPHLGPLVAGQRLVSLSHVALADDRGHLDVYVQPTTFDGEHCCLLILRDSRSHPRLERNLRRAAELEMVGRLATAVAHDLNSVLSTVSVTSMVARHADRDVHAELMDDLESAVKLGAALTQRLLAMARGPRSAPTEVDLGTTLEGLAGPLQRLVGNPVLVTRVPMTERVLVRAAPGELEQIALNLAANAAYAMPKGGSLVLRARRTRTHGEITVEDNGVGMDSATLCRVFEPFFSTRGKDAGTGLGLTTVREIAEARGGYVSIDSHVGEGTRVTVGLELATPSVQPHGGDPTDSPARWAADPASPWPRRFALVVHSPSSPDRNTERLVTLPGFVCHHAWGAGEALLVIERGHVPFAVVLAPAALPLMDGRELALRMSQLRPDLHIVLTTDDLGEAQQSYPPNCTVVREPLDASTLDAIFSALLS